MTRLQETYHQLGLPIDGQAHEILMGQLIVEEAPTGEVKVAQFIPGQGTLMETVRQGR